MVHCIRISKFFYFQIVIIVGLAWLNHLNILAQNNHKNNLTPPDTSYRDVENIDIDQKIETIVENSESEVDYSEIVDDLEHYLKRPLNLNNATADDLRRLFILNDVQISNLLEHIRKNGKLISIYELQTIRGWDLETIFKVLPYVDVPVNAQERLVTINDVLKGGKNQFFFRFQRILEEQKGFSPVDSAYYVRYPNSRYLGSPEKYYFRYRFTFLNNVSFGITGEKDYGEEFFKGTQKQGFDFYSAHLYLKNIWKIKTLAVGDYHAQFGQGLTFWTGLAFGKSSDVANIKKFGMGLKPYTSSDENRFLRGVGITHQIGNVEMTAYFSHKKIDANTGEIDTLTQEILYITSLQESGSHATPAEVADKHSLTQTIAGSHIAYKKRNLNIGGTFNHMQLDKPLQKKPNLYNQNDFTGDKLLNFGLDYNYVFRNFNFFGEVAMSDNLSMAFLNGLILSLDQRIAVSFLHRKYQAAYQNLYSAAFAEGSKTSNEEGLYSGLIIRMHNYWTLSLYYDNFSFPWLKYQTYAPSTGFDFLSQVNYKPSKKLDMYWRFRQEDKETNYTSADIATNYLAVNSKKNARYHISYKISPAFTLKNRIEWVWLSIANEPNKQGFLVYQDVAYRAMNSPFTFSFRYAIFDTDNYDTRLYAYENDVLYASSFPSYYYRGTRYYLVAKYSANRNIDFYIRFAQTVYSNVDVISSGLTEIQGNKKTEIKAQVRIKF